MKTQNKNQEIILGMKGTTNKEFASSLLFALGWFGLIILIIALIF